MNVKKIIIMGLFFNGSTYSSIYSMQDKPLTEEQKIEKGKNIARKDAQDVYKLLFELNRAAQAMVESSLNIKDQDRREMLQILNENHNLNVLFNKLCQEEPFNLYRFFGMYLKNAAADYGVFKLFNKDKLVDSECFEAYSKLFVELEKKYDKTLSLQSSVNRFIPPTGFKSNLNKYSKSHKSL